MIYEPKMSISEDVRKVLNGERGAVLAKAVESVVRYGDYMNAIDFVAITHKCGHLINTMGSGISKKENDILANLINLGAKVNGGFTSNPRTMDFENINTNFFEKFLYSKMLYNKQGEYEEVLRKLGSINYNAFTCAPYFDETGNTPKYGNILSWSDPNSISYVNSVIGAKCNLNPPIIDLLCSLFGVVPRFGYLLESKRRATWKIIINTKQRPLPHLLGACIGEIVGSEVPYIIGLDRWLGTEINEFSKAFFKDFGSACNSTGSVGLYHVEHITPEAKKYATNLLHPDGVKEVVITDEMLEKIAKKNNPSWSSKQVRGNLAFIGCPHLTFRQVISWSTAILSELRKFNRYEVCMETILFTSPQVLIQFIKERIYKDVLRAGVRVTAICPLMYTANPLTNFKRIVTNSIMVRDHARAKYVKDQTLLNMIVGGGRYR